MLVYNSVAHVWETTGNLLNWIFRGLELLIANDGSTVCEVTIAGSFEGSRKK